MPVFNPKKNKNESRIRTKEIIAEHWKEMFAERAAGMSLTVMAKKYNLDSSALYVLLNDSALAVIWHRRTDKNKCSHCEELEREREKKNER